MLSKAGRKSEISKYIRAYVPQKNEITIEAKLEYLRLKDKCELTIEEGNKIYENYWTKFWTRNSIKRIYG